MTEATTIVDGGSLPWRSGADAFESMAPDFRDNIGRDREAALGLLARYHMRVLWLDPQTTRRIDQVRVDPDYVDLSEAYHDSVEEAYFLGGTCDLSAEGHFEAGDYFWRPPGWVHTAATPTGFEAILMMEGSDESEGSDHVSRVVRPAADAGRNVREDGAIGPRGYVRRAETRFMVWRRHDDTVTGLGDGLVAKTLSSNATTGAASVLVRAEAGWQHTPAPVARERFLVNTAGTLVADGQRLTEPSLVHVPAGATAPPLEATDGLELLVKVGGPR